MKTSDQNAGLVFNHGLTIQATGLSISDITQIGRDHAAAVGPLVQIALSATLGQVVEANEPKSATQRLFEAAPSILASVIAAGTESRVSAADLSLAVKAQLLGTICRLTLEAHSPITIMTVIMMPSLAAGLIGNPSTNRPAAAAIN